MNLPSGMSLSGCARGLVQAWQQELPPSRGQGRWWVHPPPPPERLHACILKSPHRTIYDRRWLLQRFLWKQLHTKAQSHCRWRREDGYAPRATLVTWVTWPELGRTAPLPKDWSPSHAHGGKFYCLWQGTSKRGDGRPFVRCQGRIA